MTVLLWTLLSGDFEMPLELSRKAVANLFPANA